MGTIKRILVMNIGKQRGGVYVFELVEIIIHAILVAVVHAMPKLINSIGTVLHKKLDYELLKLDLGEGFVNASLWTGGQFDNLSDNTDKMGEFLISKIKNKTKIVSSAMRGI